jgi:hypothetical protein
MPVCEQFGMALSAKLLVTMLGRSHSSQEAVQARSFAGIPERNDRPGAPNALEHWTIFNV